MSILDKRATAAADAVGVYEVDLVGASDDELGQLSGEMGIGLSADEMKNVRDHFAKLARRPRDIELEALGQAWSEHCCYKSSKPVLQRHVYGIHEDRLICREDAGIMHFDGDWAYAAKIESHNHPSAIEPYGGAATGIGGVVRDVACMGAQPIALVDPLFFGSLDTPRDDLPPGTKHPRYLFDGVVAGIRDYGNRIGIPTVAGSVHFHPKFLTNCLVNVGCVGIMKKDSLIHSRAGGVGDIFILLGGRTGRDGIHGVTFASAEMEEDADESSRSAVQLGDPITKEPLIHVSLELNDRKMITGMKDLGGGGLSCVAGEMALDAGVGCVVDLDKVHLKAADMKPWEIWVSESQERMMVTTTPEQVADVLAVADKWDVDAHVVGRVIPEKVVRVQWHGAEIFEMDSEYLYGGPVYERPMELPEIAAVTTRRPPTDVDHSEVLLKLLDHENLASRESVIRQYDHEVRGRTVIKPLQGKTGVAAHGDASVLKPVAESWKGLALTCDINPHQTDIDPYWGTMSAIDEVVRNLAAVGARLDSIADNLNLPSPQKPKSMGRIEKAAQALGDSARALGIPFISGNVSMYNESPAVAIPCTPTLLGCGIVQDIRHCVTADLKDGGGAVFHVGTVQDEMAGSHYYELMGGESTAVPRVDLDITQKYAEAVVTAIEKGLVAAAHDISMGGLTIALTEMCLGGDHGVAVDLAALGDQAAEVKLYSESNTRWLLQAKDEAALVAHFAAAGVPLAKLGTSGGTRIVMRDGEANLVDVEVTRAREAFDNGLPRRAA